MLELSEGYDKVIIQSLICLFTVFRIKRHVLRLEERGKASWAYFEAVRKGNVMRRSASNGKLMRASPRSHKGIVQRREV